VEAASLHGDPKRRFSSRVDYYVRARPRYPAALLEFCRDQLHVGPEKTIADIGAGTGLLSELFLAGGNRVIGVEPNGPMRAAAQKFLSRYSLFQSVDGSAEATGLGGQSVDFLVAGTAFHWFDPGPTKREFHRILKPGSYILLVWNERRDVDAFAEEYRQITSEFSADPTPNHRHSLIREAGSPVLREFFAPGGYQETRFPNSQKLDCDELIDRALSSSNLPLPGEKRGDAMIQRLRDAFARHATDGLVQLHYDAKAYFGKI
jgi:SAM-dependent methyltransferase